MADIVDARTRSRMMSGIRGKNTKPELIIRHALHRRGFRYRLHDTRLPGKPDLVFPSRRAVILVHGCFWHGHDCHLFKQPSSRKEFWTAKITRNREKDTKTIEALSDKGWRILTIWECALKGKTRRPESEIVGNIIRWLTSGRGDMEIMGINNGHS